jgi:hypothetical protein
VQRHEARAARNLTEAAAAMPEDRYAFRPTPAQTTFGDLVLQVAAGNFFRCTAIMGTTLPPQHMLAATDPKDLLVGRLRSSFDLCNAALEHADDSFLEDSVASVGGHRITRARALIELAVDWADHYAQMAMYLRLNGLLPPSAKHKE